MTQRYLSAFVDCYICLSVNLFARFNIPMTDFNALGFCIYCAVTSNGTTNIAECVRYITETIGTVVDFAKGAQSKVPYGPVSAEDLFCPINSVKVISNGKPLYDFLFEFASSHNISGPGYCSDARHSSTSNGKQFNISRDGKHLLVLFKEASMESANCRTRSQKHLVWKQLHGAICNFPGIGPMCSLTLIQLSSMIGLLPLVFSKFASIDGDSAKRGPNKFINRCMNVINCGKAMKNAQYSTELHQNVFMKLHNEVTAALAKSNGVKMCAQSDLENILCELERCYQVCYGETYGPEKKSNVSKTEGMDKCFSSSDVNHSFENQPVKCDVLFLYRNRHYGRALQKFFRVDERFSEPFLQMISHVHGSNGKHWIEKVRLCNHLKWNYDKDKNITVHQVSDDLVREFSSVLGCSENHRCSICSTAIGKKRVHQSYFSSVPKLIEKCQQVMCMDVQCPPVAVTTSALPNGNINLRTFVLPKVKQRDRRMKTKKTIVKGKTKK